MKAPHPAGTIPHRGYTAPGRERVLKKDKNDACDAERRELLLKTQDLKVSTCQTYRGFEDRPQVQTPAWVT